MAMRPGSSKVNTVLAAWACLILGGGIALTSDASEFALATAVPLVIAGAVLLMIGLGMEDEGSSDPNSVADWEPDSTKMPDAGRVMFRVDTTLDPPIRTSILCGRCGKVDWVDGRKPKSHTCSECDTLLWESEEE
mgnify:CR=1 FL=1|tara:strand:- start:2421 stop:2825 length:405 start_codon:yes stop_codon:yes gene_type:complete